jgi:hypothetical protein
MFLKTKYKKPINDITTMLDKTYTATDQKIKALETIQNTKYFNQLYKNLKDEDFNAIYQVVKQIYIK